MCMGSKPDTGMLLQQVLIPPDDGEEKEQTEGTGGNSPKDTCGDMAHTGKWSCVQRHLWKGQGQGQIDHCRHVWRL